MNAQKIINNVPLTGLTADSRQVQPGYLFAAIPGTVADGARFIPDAIKAGARAVLAPPSVTQEDVGPDVALFHDSNPRRRLALLAAEFYAPQPETMVAVTGTNGKTSVADFTRQLWQAMKINAASIGTLGIRYAGSDGGSGLTTPDPVDLHRELGAMKAKGIDHVAMEASSHGLDMYRLDGAKFAAAAFTNLTQDHLDYHGSMEIYRAAKLRLFEELLASGGTAVVNSAAAEFDQISNIAAERKQRVIAYGLTNGQIRCIKMDHRTDGFDLELDVMGERFTVDFPIPGTFQVENALCSLGLLIGCGENPKHAVSHLSQLSGVRGRMERVGRLKNGASIYVDYAHTPDALATVLKALRPHVGNRLHAVFGCGGDRDRGKRPLMGAVAAELADMQILTDDNPRTEDPAAIRADVMPACPDALNIGDRAQAIHQAIAGLEPGDVLVIAGKGHEQGQTVGDKILPFDDADVARAAIADLQGGGG
ncbi:UDP-N-acetylmuramoyl-L-alanyl-D-glutamate--2,6-diaminopimelate ligase [Aestuariispira insulae]|uniref:UDP-N-acetylmuramoyl-L-alanyl-D-glutamate--2,6-diaminopimelate ligase n=1 Tax=Aestuariispira insulae TaxID=1461337 RepID=A0A3D9HXG4_9PROT|nr:UDP-N-acetylmuramoyl-L-alanyl-D-glutamate--2,6-diaminopimelate ligase [Aestuariispira insulae]RED54109.1 UDP-N-acetylmuramoylalanyl-D-glutamate--2,6-diaminopimelate ligase [Aestuariispira insulae]